jgi:hypothetical protein
MAIVVDRQKGKRCCADCLEGGGASGLGFIPGRMMHPGRALAKLGQAHRAGGLHKGLHRARRAGGQLGDVDMSSIVVSQATIDAESDAFDGRLNAWLLDYAGAAARLPPSFVQQVDDFVTRWRKIKDAFYFFQTSRLHDIINAEAEFNKFRDQFLGYGQGTAIGAATVTADGKTVRSDQIPPDADWLSKVRTVAIWGGVALAGAAAIKISSDLGLFKKIRSLAGPRREEQPT